jgi:RNA polymerase sigma-70 factor, ECF subfamily
MGGATSGATVIEKGRPDQGSTDHLADERALVERARVDRAAFAQIYRRYVNDVYAFTYRRGGSQEVAEEATSATFERALRSLDAYEWRDAGIKPWLNRIASNEVTEVFRRLARSSSTRGQLGLQALAADHPHDDPERAAVQLEAMRNALEQLPEKHRTVISLRYLAGMSASDTAAAMECSNASVAVALHRALKALRAVIDIELHHEGSES